MKAISSVAGALMLSVTSIVLPQSATQMPDAQQASSQQAVALLKTLAGNWKGRASMGSMRGMNAPVSVSLRVTSGGSAIMHEMMPEGRSADPANGDDDPLTVLYIDGGRLMLTHYCDSGKNRPRMVGKLSPDGKAVEFDFLDVSGETNSGTCNRPSSPSSMPIITPRTGRICLRMASLPRPTSTSLVQSDVRLLD